MESLYLLIPIALVFCVIAIRLLLWAIDNGQYDDLDKEAWKILADDSEPSPEPPASDQIAPPRTGGERANGASVKHNESNGTT
jgi:cbb3-type cytochrome oxidase maturation protein